MIHIRPYLEAAGEQGGWNKITYDDGRRKMAKEVMDRITPGEVAALAAALDGRGWWALYHQPLRKVEGGWDTWLRNFCPEPSGISVPEAALGRKVGLTGFRQVLPAMMQCRGLNPQPRRKIGRIDIYDKHPDVKLAERRQNIDGHGEYSGGMLSIVKSEDDWFFVVSRGSTDIFGGVPAVYMCDGITGVLDLLKRLGWRKCTYQEGQHEMIGVRMGIITPAELATIASTLDGKGLWGRAYRRKEPRGPNVGFAGFQPAGPVKKLGPGWRPHHLLSGVLGWKPGIGRIDIYENNPDDHNQVQGLSLVKSEDGLFYVVNQRDSFYAISKDEPLYLCDGMPGILALLRHLFP
jgi:hypothetical protein